MKVIHWNFSKETSTISGVKRYEDELYSSLLNLNSDFSFQRVFRKESKYSGTICASWFLRPQSKGADIVHATFQTFAPVALFNKPKRFIVTVHDLIPMIYPSVKKDFSARLQWYFTPNALRKVDHIIAISEFTKNELIRILNIKEEKITVIYQGVDHSRYTPLNKMECKRKFGLDTAQKHILVVASNEEHKRMDLILKISQELKKQNKQIKIVKIGYGQLLEGEEIINPGWVAESDMPALYNAADIFLNTSEYEGFGLPVLEAMACGTPVIVSNKSSLPEVVGNVGNLINLESKTCVRDFIDAILNKIDSGFDPGLIERSQIFKWEKTALETITVYNKIYNLKNTQ